MWFVLLLNQQYFSVSLGLGIEGQRRDIAHEGQGWADSKNTRGIFWSASITGDAEEVKPLAMQTAIFKSRASVVLCLDYILTGKSGICMSYSELVKGF